MTDAVSSQVKEQEKNGGLWSRLVHRLTGFLSRGEENQTLRESIETALGGHEAALEDLGPQARHMFMNILSFAELRVDDVMVPRADIVAVDVSASLDAVLALTQEESHSRMPLYRENLDEPIGMVHIKDVLGWMTSHRNDRETFDLRTVRRPVLFVPPSMPASDLLLKMQSSRIHMALVVDEYGGTDGLVSIEDLVEEIVGDIEDEHDVAERAPLIESADGSIDALARAPIEDLEDMLGLTLVDPETDDDADTLGGLVFQLVGRIPQRGELIMHPAGIEFEVRDADPRRIKRLRVHRDTNARARHETSPEAGTVANSSSTATETPAPHEKK
ncbi:MAG: HlyC/CorC family transporter [Alphaproteobacteria bacterium]|nr:HlyC/CorC family transporter [Alphaproteobacteria bacterium]